MLHLYLPQWATMDVKLGSNMLVLHPPSASAVAHRNQNPPPSSRPPSTTTGTSTWAGAYMPAQLPVPARMLLFPHLLPFCLPKHEFPTLLWHSACFPFIPCQLDLHLKCRHKFPPPPPSLWHDNVHLGVRVNAIERGFRFGAEDGTPVILPCLMCCLHLCPHLPAPGNQEGTSSLPSSARGRGGGMKRHHWGRCWLGCVLPFLLTCWVQFRTLYTYTYTNPTPIHQTCLIATTIHHIHGWQGLVHPTHSGACTGRDWGGESSPPPSSACSASVILRCHRKKRKPRKRSTWEWGDQFVFECVITGVRARKFSMSTKWMQNIFSPMFFLCSQGEHLQCFWEEEKCQTFYENIFPVFTAELCAIVMICDTTIGKNIWCLPWKREICSHKMFAHKTGHIIFSKTLKMFSLTTQEKHWRKYILHLFSRHY